MLNYTNIRLALFPHIPLKQVLLDPNQILARIIVSDRLNRSPRNYNYGNRAVICDFALNPYVGHSRAYSQHTNLFHAERFAIALYAESLLESRYHRTNIQQALHPHNLSQYAQSNEENKLLRDILEKISTTQLHMYSEIIPCVIPKGSDRSDLGCRYYLEFLERAAQKHNIGFALTCSYSLNSSITDNARNDVFLKHLYRGGKDGELSALLTTQETAYTNGSTDEQLRVDRQIAEYYDNALAKAIVETREEQRYVQPQDTPDSRLIEIRQKQAEEASKAKAYRQPDSNPHTPTPYAIVEDQIHASPITEPEHHPTTPRRKF